MFIEPTVGRDAGIQHYYLGPGAAHAAGGHLVSVNLRLHERIRNWKVTC
jgi:hypothetical protein